MRKFTLRLCTCFVQFSMCIGVAHATPGTDDNCYVAAGKRYNIDPVLIFSIAAHESTFNVKAANFANNNGTSDHGLMQINSVWLPVLKKQYGASLSDLYDPCYNIHVGSWILRQAFNKWGYSWRSVGAYNVGFKESAEKEKLRVSYANKIYSKYKYYCGVYRCTGTFRMY